MRKGWEYKKLGDLCQTCSGGTPSKSHSEYYEGGKIPWLRSGEVAQGDIYKTELLITELGLANSSAKIVPPETVCVTMYGATIGEVGVIKTSMCTNQAICNILPNDHFNPHFLRYFLMGKKNWYLSIAAGGAQPNISQDVIRKTLVPTISMQSQLAIVSELDKINELIRLKKEQLVEYDNLAQSIFYEMFGDPVENEKGWDIKNMPELCEIIDGDRGKNYPKQNEFSSVGYCLFLNAKNVTKNGFCFDECFFVSKERDELLRKGKLERGDMVLTTRGTIGNIALYDNKVSFEHVRINSGMVILRMNKFMNNTMFAKEFGIFLDSIKKKIASGSAQPQLPISSMKKIKMIVPPLPLQQSFASRIEQIEKLKSEVQNAITDLETLLASRMQYWFE